MLLRGNCLELLKTLPDESVDSVVTDPPYEIAFMGRGWDNSGIAFNPAVWAECLRVLKPGGHLLAFGASRTYHRIAVAIEDAGFEIRDSIHWVYGSGFPKSMDISKAIDKQAGELSHEGKSMIDKSTGIMTLVPSITPSAYVRPEPVTEGAKQWLGWGTALKPAHEPVVVARKPVSEKTVAQNVLKHGTGAINIDGSLVGEGDNDGRWPANVIHDGSDEVIAEFPDTKGKVGAKQLTSFRFQPGEEWDEKQQMTAGTPDHGSAARFFQSCPIDDDDAKSFIYCSKASKTERNAGLGHLPEVEKQGVYKFQVDGSLNKKITAPKANIHPTVKPIALMRYLVKLVTPPGGTVLDPFCGSGTTAVSAVLEGFNWIGCELTPDYWPIIEGRVKWAEEQVK